MLQYYKVILTIIYDTLKWTETKKSSGKKKPYCNLRIAAYKSLSFWCNSMKFGSCVEVIVDDLFKQIEYDITPFQNELTLQVLSGAKKHMSKKARRQLHKTQNEASNLNQKHSSAQTGSKVVLSDEGNQGLCVAALNCLRGVLLSSSCFIKPTIIKDIQDRVISICLSLPKSYGEREKLYSNQFTRRALYEVLESIVVANNHLCPPPTELVIKFVSAGSTEDPSEKVKDICLNLLRRLEKVIHPQKDCLYFPPNLKDIENVFSRYGRPLGSKKPEQEVESSEEEVVESSEEEVFVENKEEDKDEEVDEDEENETDENENPTKTIDLTEEKIVAMEVIESSDDDDEDCVVTDFTKDDSEGEEETEPLLRLVVESDDEDEKQVTASTSEEPSAKKSKIEVTSDFNLDDEKLLEEIASTFVDELVDDEDDEEDYE